jgi:hypothetical protein
MLAARLRESAERLRAAADCLRAAPEMLRGWAGAGSLAFLRAAAAGVSRLRAMGDALDLVASALMTLVAVLDSLQSELAAARRVLAAAGPTHPQAAVAGLLTDAADRFRAADLRAASMIAQALLADLAGSRLAFGARAGPALQAAALAQQAASVPPLPSSPPAVAVWWAGLPATARSAAESGGPGWPGGRDGVPAPVRDAVNRRLLADALSAAQQSYDRTPTRELWKRLAAASRLRTLRSLAAAVAPAGSQLLLFDPSGDGEAVVSTADVQTSRSVAVLVPGMANQLDDFSALAEDSRRLARAAGPGTAVVAWLGYDAPNARQVSTDARAKAGAATLQSFIVGLRATATGAQHVTVIGHSYGSLVAGLAAKGGLPGVEVNRASELHLRPGHVWAAEALTDPIRLVFAPSWFGRLYGVDVWPVYGPDPASAAFGARHFPDGGAYGHSGYFAAGSQSLASLGTIVSGRSLP